MDIKECFNKRLLRKIFPSREKASSSIKIAESKLAEAKKLFEKDFFNNAVLSAYTSMFHAARALLYQDGIQEKSHYATYIYIRERYSGKISKSLINSFNNSREERHEILYGFEHKFGKKEAENVILDAEEFLQEVKKIYEEKNKGI